MVSFYRGVHTKNKTIPSIHSSHRRDMEIDVSKYYDAHLYSYPHHHHFHKSHNEPKKHEKNEPRKDDDSRNGDEVEEGNANEINNEDNSESKSYNWSCEWSPTSHNECSEMLSNRVSFENQRWLFFGDSTMKRLFLMSNLGKVLIDEPHKKLNEEQHPCKSDLNCDIRRQGDRCDLHGVFGFEPPKKWKKPSFYPKFEGPANYGATHPYCSDCVGCETEFLHCTQYDSNDDVNKTNSEECEEDKLVYGGYMMIEFAKDLELQTSVFRTTQENIAWFIHDKYNTPELLSKWGKPICVILTGFHDMILLIKTEHFSKKHFVENVEWYLTIMQSICGHIVWVTNTTPSRENPK